MTRVRYQRSVSTEERPIENIGVNLTVNPRTIRLGQFQVGRAPCSNPGPDGGGGPKRLPFSKCLHMENGDASTEEIAHPQIFRLQQMLGAGADIL